MAANPETYAARLQIDYPERLDRVTTFFRLICIIPIGIVLGVLVNQPEESVAGPVTLSIATVLMIVFRQRYPRWWFDFVCELMRFTTRVGAYLALLTDRYPSTVDEQSVHLEIDYPDVKHDLNRWLPLVKWFLALPHLIVMLALAILVLIAVVIAWFAILLTGRYPRSLFDFVVGVARWVLRVQAYAFLFVTDRYPTLSHELNCSQTPQEQAEGASHPQEGGGGER